MSSTKKTWFITGAAGFIGSNLCEYLLNKRCKVIGYDNLSTGYQHNIDRLKRNSNKNFKFIKGDILDKSISLKDVDIVVHLAAQVSVIKSIKDPLENNDINVSGFLNILNKSVEFNVKRFIYASSCAVYGENNNLPLDEKEILNPMSPYALSKIINESYANFYMSKINITGLRFFNVFGPYQDPLSEYSAVIPKWINALINNQSPIIFGDGSATRDFIYVLDIARLIHQIGTTASSNKQRIYNIGSGVETSLKHLIKIIVGKTKKEEIKLIYKDARAGEIINSVAKIKNVVKDFNFIPTGLDEAMGPIIESYKK